MKGLRIGNGFDAHRLVPGRPLMLGGVQVPFDRGLLGHSDGDCLLHAICDSLLGATAEGDLGHYFPNSDPRWKGASSRIFLVETARMLSERGYGVANLDATIIAEAPPLAPHTERMRRVVAECLGLDLADISIKAKSCDSLGALGRSEGIAAMAVVLIHERGA